MRDAELLSRYGFGLTIAHFEDACKASREWNTEYDRALEAHGDEGSFISAIGRAHFPSDVKMRLRALARAVTAESDAAYSARPVGARKTTVTAIGRAVARRDGSGFYGPRA